eukprot:11818844-Alexandrium_andersonii.AAC.1
MRDSGAPPGLVLVVCQLRAHACVHFVQGPGPDVPKLRHVRSPKRSVHGFAVMPKKLLSGLLERITPLGPVDFR